MKKNTTIKTLLKEDRPYEKCLAYGPERLSDAELLAAIIRTGTSGTSSIALAEEVLRLSKKQQGLLGLCHLTLKELTELSGIGQVKAIQLLCIGELSKRMATYRAWEGLRFDEPSSIARYYVEQMRHAEQEMMICMMLDTKNHLIGDEILSVGTVNASLVSPRELFILAVKYHAVQLILVHNHPSGDATPSQADMDLTKRIKQAGELMDIHLLDHIIIGDCQYVSFRESKIL